MNIICIYTAHSLYGIKRSKNILKLMAIDEKWGVDFYD